MQTKADVTKTRILDCAREEFLSAGFAEASLRRIAAQAEVTTGAIYRYFPDKRALFAAATEEAAAQFHKMMDAACNDTVLAASEGVSFGPGDSRENMAKFYGMIYESFDQFYLLLMCGDETGGRSFLHEFVKVEEESTLAYLDALKQHYGSDYAVDEVALHFLLEAYVSALMEPVRHRMSREDAILHAQNLSVYFAVGWLGVERLLRGESEDSLVPGR